MPVSRAPHGTSAANPVRVGPFFDPAFVAPVQAEIRERNPHASDEGNTAQTIALMRSYAESDATDPIIATAARQAWPHATGNPIWSGLIADQVHRWIRAHVEFLDGSELVRYWRPESADEDQVLIRPVDVLAMRTPRGDCAVFSMLAASMLLALDVTDLAFRTVKSDPTDPGQYSHVYLTVSGIPLDASHGPYLGWEVKQVMPVYGERDWPVIENPMIQTIAHKLGRLAETVTLDFPQVDDSETSAGFDWSSLIPVISTAATDASKILSARYGVAQYAGSLSPGQTVKLNDGTLLTQLPTGITQAVGGAANTGLLLGAAGLLAVAIFASRRN